MAFAPLPDQVRADLFLHLSVMERSGLPPDKAFALLNLPPNLKERIDVFRRLLAKGADIPTSGFQSGLFSELETNLIRAACLAGSPGITYRRLATRYSHKARLASLIRSRMSMPLLVLLIALAVQPLPALVSGAMSASVYVLSIMRPFVVLGGCVFLYGFIARQLSVLTDDPSPVQVALSTILTHVPLFGAMAIRKNVRDFYENLALLLEAGIPMFDALPKAVNTVTLCTIRADFALIQPLMEQGASLSTAVSKLHFQDNDSAQSFIATGEGSGSLPEMILRFADGESDALARLQVQLADWLPRLFYGAVAAVMVYQILGSSVI